MPIPLFRAYVEMRPRIEAGRFLDGYATTAAGTGRLTRSAVQGLLNTARNQMGGQGQQAGYRPRTTADWAAIPGVQVIHEKKKG